MALAAPGTLLGYVQGLYGNEEDSDCSIRFYQPQGGTAEPRKWLSDAIPAHTLVLKAASERLRMQLKNPGWQQTRASYAAEDTDEQQQQKRRKLGTPDGAADAGTGTSDGNVHSTSAAASAWKPQLLVALDGPHELQPALEVLQCMYTGSLSAAATASPYDTVLTYKLAQYLLAPAVKEACLARLREVKADDAALQTSACRLFTTREVAFALDEPELRPFVDACWAAVLALLASPEPPAAQGVDRSLDELLEQCWDAVVAQHDERRAVQRAAQALLARLGDTLRVAHSEQLSAMLCRLPLGALQLLMQHDQLTVDCEDTVLLLLHRWAVHNAPLPEGATAQLRELLWPLQLSSSYRSHLLPHLAWLGLTSAEAADLGYAASMLGQACCQEVFENLAMHAAQPEWLLPCRDAAADTSSQEVQLAMVVQQRELEERLAELSANAAGVDTSTVDWLFGTPQYWMGYKWRLKLKLYCKPSQNYASDAGPASDAGTDGEAGLFVECSLPEDFAALGVRTATSFLVKYSMNAERTDEAERVKRHSGRLMSTGASRGWPRYFMSSGALDVASWQPWLVGGALRVKATLWRV